MPKVKLEAKKVTVKKTVVKAPVKTAVKTQKTGGLSVDVFSTSGIKSGTLELPKEIFGGKINNPLMAQAVRVYLANQRTGTASTKTRGEVEGSSRKIYRQKGTGRARHGSIRAPIFVKGGIVFGPKPRDFSLDLPKKMKKAAVVSALSAKAKDGEIRIVSGLEKIDPKTKIMAKLVAKLSGNKKVKTLLVTSGSSKDGLTNLFRASRNIKEVQLLSANLLNTYELLNSRQVLFMREAIEVLNKNFTREK